MLSAILCADWSKESARRAAYVAEVPTRLVKRLGSGPFTLTSLVKSASAYSGEGSVLVGLDAPLGASRSLLAATHRDLGLSPTATFLDWVPKVSAWPDFFSRPEEAEPWSPLRPFFKVSPGTDARNRVFRTMREGGVEPLRDVDTVTAAKSLFILSGIPGSVGSSVVDLWPALSGILANRPAGLGVWPFDRDQPDTGAVVLAEMYPRALYASALALEAPPLRARLSIAKGDARCRRAAVESLLAQDWVRDHGVRFEDADPLTISEDSFDALLSAAALLRCVIEGTPLGWSKSDAFEGGILGLDSLNLSLPERTFRCGPGPERPSGRRSARRSTTDKDRGRDSPFLQRPATDWIASNDLAFAIPDPFPVSPGHTLIVTKRLVPTWFDANRYERLAVIDLIGEVKRILDRRTPAPDGYNVGFNAGAAAGQTVIHLHVHVIPRYAGDVPDPTGGIRNIIRRS